MRLTLPAILLLMLSAVAPLGCGGSSDQPSLKEYYAELIRVQVEGQQRTPAANVNLGEIPADARPEELHRLLKAGLTASRELNAAFLEDLKSIDTPAEAETAHGELVAAIDALDAWLNEMIAGVDGVASLEEFGAMTERSAFIDAEQAFIEACRKLQRIADANSIVVDLACTH